jgi:dTMP kinase
MVMFDGAYVAVWEGVDGSGKTTLMAETAGRLRSMGYSVESYKTPSNTSTGLFAKDYGNREDTDPLTRMLVFLANTADDSRVMKKIIREKKPQFMFVDRYYACSIVYGFALLAKRFSKKYDKERLLQFFRQVEDLGSETFIKPDLTVVVDVDPETRMQRALGKQAGSDAAFERDEMLQNLVRQYYDYLVSYLGDYALKVFNADNALKQLSNSLAEELLRRRGRTR